MVLDSIFLIPRPIPKQKVVFLIFITLNLLALLHFGLLQVRHAFEDYYVYEQSRLLVKLIATYNVWALGGWFVMHFLPKKVKWYQHLFLFLALTVLYSFMSALFYNSGTYQIWRGFVINITGLIHLNLLFYLVIVFLVRHFRGAVTNEDLSAGRLIINEGKTIRSFDKSEIVFIKAEQNYVLIGSSQDKPVLVRKTLKEIADQVQSDQDFLHIQRSYIVNRHFVSALGRAANGTDLICEVTTGDTFPVSRKKRDWLRSRLTSEW